MRREQQVDEYVYKLNNRDTLKANLYLSYQYLLSTCQNYLFWNILYTYINSSFLVIIHKQNKKFNPH